MTAIDDMVAANHRYAELMPAPLPKEPKRALAVVTCMDTRLDLLDGLGFVLGDVHFLRNAGGLVTDDMLRSLVVSQSFLGTTEIAIIHHTRCGMIGLDDAAFRAELEAGCGVPPTWDVPGIVDLAADVVESVQRVRDCPWLPHRGDVRGFVLDVDTAALTEITG